MNKRLLKTQKAILFGSGALLIAVGAFILVSPHAFFSANNIDLGANISLLNELKAPAALLLLAGVYIIAGVFVRRFFNAATWLAALIYLSYAASRFLSMAVDGLPAEGLVQAAVLEGIVGLLCLAMVAPRREPKTELA